ncbi:MAG TPA: DUF4149 domain-containing protein [Gemmatimonadaceae bacterium]|jgi:hypothetical protein|nr:DUF4149 domain-containing protein [Gemmatimonadaceae bacterium]
MAPTLFSLILGSAWLGASAIVAVVVAPAAFAVLPSRTLAGALVGRVLPVLFWSGMLVALATIVSAWSLPARAARIGAGVVLLLGCAAAQLIVSPRIERIRAGVAGPIDALSPADPRRLEFGRLHGMSVGLLGLAMIACLVGVVLLSRSLPSLRDS